ncbi:Hypothetical_protein [Hexamita inflata]|nr:Hypothetical protein HINF_LOCUS41053 [Hexamita inflata]
MKQFTQAVQCFSRPAQKVQTHSTCFEEPEAAFIVTMKLQWWSLKQRAKLCPLCFLTPAVEFGQSPTSWVSRFRKQSRSNKPAALVTSVKFQVHSNCQEITPDLELDLDLNRLCATE